VEGHGQRSNCGRTNKDGIDFVKAAAPGFERYIALYLTPQADGGCQGCRFFLMCKGQCPGTAIDGDWRNRTEHCEVWKAIYGVLEEEMKAAGTAPLSISPRRETIERGALAAWASGQNPTIAQLLGQPAAPRRKKAGVAAAPVAVAPMKPARQSAAGALKGLQKQVRTLAANEFSFHIS
jgi:uncharacterized protein